MAYVYFIDNIEYNVLELCNERVLSKCLSDQDVIFDGGG